MSDPEAANLTPPHTPGQNCPAPLETNLPPNPTPVTIHIPESPMESITPTTNDTSETRQKIITPAPGPVITPYDAQMDFNVHPLPSSFNYQVKGLSDLHLRLNLSERAGKAWENAPDHSVIIVPLFMNFSLSRMQEGREDVTTLLSRAFPDSAPTISVIPAAKKSDIKSNEAPLWGILVAGLKYQDAATLIHHQFWLSKKLSFIAFPSTPFTLDWLGNWAFSAKEKDHPTILECLQANLSDPTTRIGAYLAINIPDPDKRQTILDSAQVRALKIKRNGTESTHWSFTV